MLFLTEPRVNANGSYFIPAAPTALVRERATNAFFSKSSVTIRLNHDLAVFIPPFEITVRSIKAVIPTGERK